MDGPAKLLFSGRSPRTYGTGPARLRLNDEEATAGFGEGSRARGRERQGSLFGGHATSVGWPFVFLRAVASCHVRGQLAEPRQQMPTVRFYESGLSWGSRAAGVLRPILTAAP